MQQKINHYIQPAPTFNNQIIYARISPKYRANTAECSQTKRDRARRFASQKSKSKTMRAAQNVTIKLMMTLIKRKNIRSSTRSCERNY